MKEKSTAERAAAPAIGESFYTPDQADWRAAQKHYGEHDVDRGAYHMSAATIDKTHTAWVRDLDGDGDGWMDAPCDYGHLYAAGRGR